MKKRRYQGIVMMGIILMAGLMMDACKCKCPPPPPPPKLPAVTLSLAVVGSVEIKAPVEKVFGYLSDFNNATSYFPGIKSVSNIQGQGLGASFHWVYEVEGLKGEGDYITTEYVPNQKTAGVSYFSFGQETLTSLFQPGAEGGTKLTIIDQATEDAPDEAAKQAASKIIRDRLPVILNNIKTAVEK